MELKTSFLLLLLLLRQSVSQSHLVVYSLFSYSFPLLLLLLLLAGHCRRLYCIQLTRESKRDPDRPTEREEVLARLLLLLPGCQQKEKETDRQRERGQIIPFTNEEEEEETYSSSSG